MKGAIGFNHMFDGAKGSVLNEEIKLNGESTGSKLETLIMSLFNNPKHTFDGLQDLA